MTTADSDALTERLAMAWAETTPERWEALGRKAPGLRERTLRDFAPVAALVAADIRKAQADALREAADGMDNTDDQDWHHIADGDADEWLRARADRIEKEAI